MTDQLLLCTHIHSSLSGQLSQVFVSMESNTPVLQPIVRSTRKNPLPKSPTLSAEDEDKAHRARIIDLQVRLDRVPKISVYTPIVITEQDDSDLND